MNESVQVEMFALNVVVGGKVLSSMALKQTANGNLIGESSRNHVRYEVIRQPVPLLLPRSEDWYHGN